MKRMPTDLDRLSCAQRRVKLVGSRTGTVSREAYLFYCKCYNLALNGDARFAGNPMYILAYRYITKWEMILTPNKFYAAASNRIK